MDKIYGQSQWTKRKPMSIYFVHLLCPLTLSIIRPFSLQRFPFILHSDAWASGQRVDWPLVPQLPGSRYL